MNPELVNRGSNKFFTKCLFFVIIVCSVLGGGCRNPQSALQPSIIFTKIPPAADGGPDKVGTIEGTVTNARPGQQIVLYAKSGVWWVQPFADQPFTKIETDSNWKSSTHYGTEYAALLVEPDYLPLPRSDTLPLPGNGIVAVESVKGEQNSTPEVVKTLNFSGYEWKIRTNTSDRGATINYFDSANAWVDANGFLHLRIAKQSEKWTCAEISLTRSLGYGKYNFVVSDVSQLEPAAVFSMFTWDDLEADRNHREMDIEVSRWGDPANQNMQFVIQPYYIPANVARFAAPPGVLTHSFDWGPGRVKFKMIKGKVERGKEQVITEHSFTSGIPAPEGETIHLNLYVFGFGKNPLQKETEIIIEKFEFLP